MEPPNGKFKKGMVENFSFDALDVGKIKEIEVGFTTSWLIVIDCAYLINIYLSIVLYSTFGKVCKTSV